MPIRTCSVLVRMTELCHNICESMIKILHLTELCYVNKIGIGSILFVMIVTCIVNLCILLSSSYQWAIHACNVTGK